MRAEPRFPVMKCFCSLFSKSIWRHTWHNQWQKYDKSNQNCLSVLFLDRLSLLIKSMVWTESPCGIHRLWTSCFLCFTSFTCYTLILLVDSPMLVQKTEDNKLEVKLSNWRNMAKKAKKLREVETKKIPSFFFLFSPLWSSTVPLMWWCGEFSFIINYFGSLSLHAISEALPK